MFIQSEQHAEMSQWETARQALRMNEERILWSACVGGDKALVENMSHVSVSRWRELLMPFAMYLFKKQQTFPHGLYFHLPEGILYH